jgi:hypothetical protein
MAGRVPATHAAPHHRPMCLGAAPDWRDQRLTNRVGGRIKSGHDDVLSILG